MYPAAVIANYFIERSNSEGLAIDQMKVQKLVYYAHGWYLAMTDEPLIDEQVEAWRFGPVIPSLYRVLKHCGNQSIKRLIQPAHKELLAFDVQSFLDRIWDLYSHLSGIQLSNLTHQHASPWSRIAKRFSYQIPPNHPLDNDLLRGYFVTLRQKLTRPI
jgi:uncharacterized phage-associated protein